LKTPPASPYFIRADADGSAAGPLHALELRLLALEALPSSDTSGTGGNVCGQHFRQYCSYLSGRGGSPEFIAEALAEFTAEHPAEFSAEFIAAPLAEFIVEPLAEFIAKLSADFSAEFTADLAEIIAEFSAEPLDDPAPSSSLSLWPSSAPRSSPSP
jgi:hypothetical protein